MNLISLHCNECAAPLQIAEDARFVTCSFCHCQLAVEHAGGGWTTRIIEQIQKQTETLSTDVRDLQKQLALEQLDRQWAEELQRSYSGGNIPSPWFFAILGLLFMALLIVLSFTFPAHWQKSVPEIIIVIGITSMMAVGSAVRRSWYRQALLKYEQKRCRILDDKGKPSHLAIPKA